VNYNYEVTSCTNTSTDTAGLWDVDVIFVTF